MPNLFNKEVQKEGEPIWGWWIRKPISQYSMQELLGQRQAKEVEFRRLQSKALMGIASSVEYQEYLALKKKLDQ